MSLVAAIKNRTTGLITNLVRRSEELDAVLSSVGYDPNTLNKISTPLIGASRYMSAKLLIRSNGLGSTDVPFVASGNADQTDLFDLLLYEPDWAGTGGKGSTTDQGTGPNGTVVISTTGSNNTTIGTGSGSGSSQNSLVPSASATAGTNLVTPTNVGRKLQWSKLVCVSVQELIISAGAQSQTISYRPANDLIHPAIFVLEFVDARYFLATQMMVEITSPDKAQKGVVFDQWNMIAENPLHLASSTILDSTRIAPDNTESLVTNAGYEIDAATLYGIPQPNPWYEQTAMTANEIITQIISELTISKMWADKEFISFYDNGVSEDYEPKSKFDCINLDLRSRSVGDALDEIASRIGCVWVWDRRQSRLVLEQCDPIERKDILNDWFFQNEMYRGAGGLNSLSIDMPASVVTIHPIRLCSTYGFASDQIIQDYRTIPVINGVDDFLPTQPFFYVNQSPRTESTNNRTAFIGDHLPAFIGVVDKDPKKWQENIPTVEGDVTSAVPVPWNLDDKKLTDAYWFSKPYAEDLETRNRILNRRYGRLRGLISGNLMLTRLPAYNGNAMASMTPSIGLNMEEIHFGSEMTKQIQYRIFGNKNDPLLLPSLFKTERVSALGLSRCRNVMGTLNIEYLRPRAGVVRTFICSFTVDQILRTEPLTGEAIMWLYTFREVQLTNLPYPKWQQQDEAGQMIGAATGYAMNLCELSPSNLSVTPNINFDGGKLKYTDPSTPSQDPDIHMTSAGGLVGGFAPCYEIITESGATTYWIYAANGVDVKCATAALMPAANGAWIESGVSGIAFVNNERLTSIIRQ